MPDETPKYTIADNLDGAKHADTLKTEKSRNLDLTAITGILTAITILAFAESAIFVYGVTLGLGLDLTIYMQPWDYVIITPSWLWTVLFILPWMIAFTFLDVLFKKYAKGVEQLTKPSLAKPHRIMGARNRLNLFLGLLEGWWGRLIWIAFAIFVSIVLHKTSRFLPIHPTPIQLIPWQFWAGFGPPALSVRFFVWLFRKFHLPVSLPYKNLLLALLASLSIAALTYGYFYFALEALTSTASTRISLKAENNDNFPLYMNRIIRGTILFKLTDRLLVLSQISDSKKLRRNRSIIVIPLTEVRLIEATQ
jgi:hypothetical protein